ncbi:MAG: hypothetical protein O2963_01125 [Proteobacteria bacterium]|jgi:predicted metal-dependent enzyme (double-stranded beta helix superfamily)|nr:hypothetical protein [Pseudomonadota bacterium]
MSNIKTQRDKAVKTLLKDVRSLAGPVKVSRDNINIIKSKLVAISERNELWNEDEFPAPTGDQVHTRYLISQDDDESYALYLNVMLTGKKTPPHNHTTWACISAVEGEEYNYVYEPKKEGPLVPGDREISQKETIIVKPGQGIGLLADDIHAIEIKEGVSTRHLHLYGKALETLSERLMWDKELKTCEIFKMVVKTTK